jgi:hypothetical protein
MVTGDCEQMAAITLVIERKIYGNIAVLGQTSPENQVTAEHFSPSPVLVSHGIGRPPVRGVHRPLSRAGTQVYT